VKPFLVKLELVWVFVGRDRLGVLKCVLEPVLRVDFKKYMLEGGRGRVCARLSFLYRALATSIFGFSPGFEAA